MVSVIGSFYTLSAAMDKIPNMKVSDWAPKNALQQLFLEIYKDTTGAEIPEIESKVSVGDVTPVNAFLKERGFDIQLAPIKPKDLAIASILDVMLKWLSKGEKTDFYYKSGKYYDAIDLTAGVAVVRCDGFPNAVAIIDTKNGDKVYMTVPAEAPDNAFTTLRMAKQLTRANTSPASHYYQQVIFPKVDLDVKPSLNWLIGLSDPLEEKWRIDQALQQTKVKMDEEGVRIKEAVALGIRCCCASFDTKVPLRIENPFLFVVTRANLKVPFFSAYIDTDGWVKTANQEGTNLRTYRTLR